MVFHMNRLGFLSEDTVIMSQPGDYLDFVGSIAVSDADPIDMATSTRPANLPPVSVRLRSIAVLQRCPVPDETGMWLRSIHSADQRGL